MGGAVKAVAGIAVAAVGAVTGLTPLVGIGIALALSGASQMLAPKPSHDSGIGGFTGSTQSPSLAVQQQERLHNVRSSIAPRQIIYGETVVSGAIVAVFSSGSDNEYIHLFVCLAGHEVSEIKTIWFDDTESTDAKFSGLFRNNTHTGSSSQTADSDAVSEITEWTTNHRLRGIAYVYTRLKWDADVWLRGIPNIKALVKGKKIYDPRDTLTDWTDNPILCQRDFLINEFGVTSTAIDDTVISAQANVCDEAVSLRVSASITAFADAGGGKVDATSVNHGLSIDGTITISGTSNYNGTVSVTNITTDTFEFVDTFAGTETGDWTKAITAAADGGGGKVVITSAEHRLANGTTVTIAGTSDYNGDFEIDEGTRDTFEITDTWVSSQTGTITAATQKRYVCNGAMNRADTPVNMVEKLKTSCAGTNLRQQGVYKLYAGAYVSPTVTLDEDDLRANLELQTKDSRKDLYNAVKGEYVNAADNYLPANFPPLTNSSFEADDGGLQIFKSIQLAFTDDSVRAQRIAKIHQLRSRQGNKVSFPAKMTAYELAAWDTVSLNIDKLGWSSKSFRILSWALAADGGGVDLELQEDSAADWAWLSSDELAINIPPDMPVVDPLSIGAPVTPTGLAATARKLTIELTWTDNAAQDIQGYDIQRADNSGFTTNLVTLSEAHKGTYYIDDIGVKATQRYYRIRAVDRNGNVSAYTSGVNATTDGIDTPEVVDNAITKLDGSNNTGSVTGSGTTWTDGESISITTEGNKVLVWGVMDIYSDWLGTFNEVRLWHNNSSTLISQSAVESLHAWSADGWRVNWGGAGGTAPGMTHVVALIGTITPTAGSNTFKLQFRNNNASATPTAWNRGIIAMEVKK